MKKCPYCAEEIQEEAVKCKHCGEWLKDKGSLSADKEVPSTDKTEPLKAESINKLSEKQQPHQDLPKSILKTFKKVEEKSKLRKQYPPKKCPQCGNFNLKGVNICRHCGKKQKIPWGWGWFILLTIFVTGIKELSYPDSEMGAIASMFLPLAAIVFLLFFYFWFRNRMIRKDKYGGKKWMAGLIAAITSYFVTLIILFPFLLVVEVVERRSQEHNLTSTVMQDYRSLFKDFIVGKEIKKEQSPQSYGKLSSHMALMKKHMIISQQDTLDFNAALEKENFFTIYSPENVSNQNKIIGARHRLKKIRQLHDDYEKLHERRKDEIINAMNNLDLPYTSKKALLEGAFRGIEKGDELTKKFFRIRREYVAELDKLFIFFNSRTGEYKVVGEQISFNSDEDGNQYNKHIKKIDKIIEQEDKWHDEQQQIMSSRMQKFDDEIKKFDKSAK